MLQRTSLGIRILLGLGNEHKETHVSENQGMTFRVRHVQLFVLCPLTVGMHQVVVTALIRLYLIHL